MKKIILLFALCTLCTTSFAAKKIDSAIWNFSLGPSIIKAEESGNTLDTFHASIGMQKTFYSSRFTIGGYAAYLAGQENEDMAAIDKVNYRTIPVLLDVNYLFSTSSLQPYLNLGAGVQFSQLEFYENNTRIIDHDAGIALAGGGGLVLFMSEGLGIHANYRFLWINNQNFKSGLAHMISIGLSFRRISFFYE